MSPVKRLFLLFPLLGLLASCSEDFDVAAPYKNVTVVYGLLDKADTAHYIRIQKAFLDENKSALDMATSADSSFYKTISVHLKELTDTGKNGNLLFDETLNRVDLTNEGYPKTPGAFFTAPNYAYKTTRALTSGRAYRLVITNPATGQVDSAETFLIDNTKSPPPVGFNVPKITAFYSISFAVRLSTNTFDLDVQIPQSSQTYEGIVRFHYLSRDGAGNETIDSSDYHFATASRDQEDPTRASVKLSVPEISFYYFLAGAMGPAPSTTSRFMDSCDVFVWAASKDFADYQTINGAQGGITADQIKPIFTNIKSNQNSAIGIFTSRAHLTYRNIPINDITMDSLATNSITYPLNIRGRTTK